MFELSFSETLEESSRWQNNCFSVYTADGDVVLYLATKHCCFQIALSNMVSDKVTDFLKAFFITACGK